MPRNSTTMIHAARQEFDQLLDSLSAQAKSEATAYQVERNLFAQLLALGRRLLEVFFALFLCALHRAQRGAERLQPGRNAPSNPQLDVAPLRVGFWGA